MSAPHIDLSPLRRALALLNDLLRTAADAGLMPDAIRWRAWREMRNATSHAYDEVKAQAVASGAAAFALDAAALLAALEASLAN